METYLIILIIGILLVLFLLKRTTPETKHVTTPYHFQKKDKVMTEAEARFFEKLTDVIGERFIIIPQAHLSTFIDHRIKGQNWKAAFSVINGKSVDYLLVEKNSLKPIAAIELDDWSHKREDRIARDQKVKDILNEIGILLVRFDNPDISGQAIVDTFSQLVQAAKESEIQK